MINFSEKLEELRTNGLQRHVLNQDTATGRFISIQGESALNFSSNNYLGFANHPKLKKAAIESVHLYGTGAGASRLITGSLPIHSELEHTLANFHGTESACLFASGYQANIGLISSIADSGDFIFSDELNHASIIDGCRLSRATTVIYEHLNLAHLEQELIHHSEVPNKFVVSDSVFSMNGDSPDLHTLQMICARHQAFLILDETHAIGTIGLDGTGLAGRKSNVDAIVGGFGKALGATGGYVAGSRELCQYLLNRARSYVYSTATSPSIVGASIAAVELLQSSEGQEQVALLRARIRQFAKGLSKLGRLEEGAGQGPIFPFRIEKQQEVLAVSSSLVSKGVYCVAIRPPTVPVGTARLRIALSSLHLEEDIEKLLDLLTDIY